MEEEEIVITDSDVCYPVLLIPKSCTTLETNCAATDNVFIKLNITTIDTQGNESTIYSGFCNVKIIDRYDFGHNKIKTDSNLSDSDNVLGEVTLMDTNDPCYNDNQTEMLIDPTNNPYVSNDNPYVSNDYGTQEVEESYLLYQAHREHIAVRQHNTYITQNVYEAIHYSPVSEFEHKKFGRVQMVDETNQQPSIDEELECGMILSQLPEEILLANQNKAREEMRYVDLPSDNDAIKQLMSSDLQKQRQQRTILYLGDSSHRGHTVQKITINDPQVECVQGSPDSHLVVVDESPREKKYQCEKCDQIFYQIQAFRQHIQVKHTARSAGRWPAGASEFECRECGKRFKTREKYELHRLGHGDPDLECSQCRKVFASKITLKNHAKIHDRKHECRYCTRTYRKAKDLGAHLAKIHSVYKCDECEFSTHKCEELEGHRRGHGGTRSDSETTESLDAWTDTVTAGAEYAVTYEPQPQTRKRRHDPDSVIARVMSNKVFLLNSKRAARLMKKRCNICHKTFDRVSDLKRHLIEHILRSSLAKDPVDDSGALAIRCEVCHAHTFTQVDRYKAHLREHAKLTIYKCTFCDKTFSDSSNFSKHKKIHSTKFFQCDLCRRKFSSKKTIIEHLQYHGRNGPVQCPYCTAEFHFPSVLKKHMKLAHTRKPNRANCKFCGDSFKTLKDKWDHEWKVHNVRKMIVDCLLCGSKFRKYSDLKAHCIVLHDIQIPPARRLLQKRKHRK